MDRGADRPGSWLRPPSETQDGPARLQRRRHVRAEVHLPGWVRARRLWGPFVVLDLSESGMRGFTSGPSLVVPGDTLRVKVDLDDRPLWSTALAVRLEEAPGGSVLGLELCGLTPGEANHIRRFVFAVERRSKEARP